MMTKTLKPMRVLITGGRPDTLKKLGLNAGDVHCLVVKTLNIISAGGKRKLTIIHGGANGVDSMADTWAAATKTDKEVYPITKEDWQKLGNVAGPLRNTEMLDKGKPDLLAAFPGGRGTADMVGKCRAAGVRVYEAKL